MNTGLIAETVYILACFSQSGASKVSKPKYPAVMKTVESLVDAGICETRFWPTWDAETSILVSQVISDFEAGGEEDREVAKTWLVGFFE